MRTAILSFFLLLEESCAILVVVIPSSLSPLDCVVAAILSEQTVSTAIFSFWAIFRRLIVLEVGVSLGTRTLSLTGLRMVVLSALLARVSFAQVKVSIFVFRGRASFCSRFLSSAKFWRAFWRIACSFLVLFTNSRSTLACKVGFSDDFWEDGGFFLVFFFFFPALTFWQASSVCARAYKRVSRYNR